MTRENKLALVVGFGLILLVGILLSDHFSATRRPGAADLAGSLVDPLTRAGADNPGLIDMPAPRDSLRNSELLLSPGAVSDPDRRNTTVQRIVMGASHRTVTPAAPPSIGGSAVAARAGSSEPDSAYHTVRPGETLTSIARQHYGNSVMVDALVSANDLANPNALRPGDRLRIPAGAGLPRPELPAPPPAAATTEHAASTYVVKPGDSLSEIASDLFGSGRRWREIYEMNRDVIQDPDNVVAGTRLKIARPR